MVRYGEMLGFTVGFNFGLIMVDYSLNVLMDVDGESRIVLNLLSGTNDLVKKQIKLKTVKKNKKGGEFWANDKIQSFKDLPVLPCAGSHQALQVCQRRCDPLSFDLLHAGGGEDVPSWLVRCCYGGRCSSQVRQLLPFLTQGHPWGTPKSSKVGPPRHIGGFENCLIHFRR